MKIIKAKRREIDLDEYKNRYASEDDYSRFIDHSCVITEDGVVKAAYLELGDELDSAALVRGLQSIKYDTGYRTLGLKSTSRVLGFQPRLTIRRDYCTAARLASEKPDVHRLLLDFAAKADAYYKEYNPELHKEHEEKKKDLLPDYQIKDSVFTSGIINKNNQLMYHFDRGNVNDVWSNMLVFKYREAGGFLSVPQYDMGFELKHNSLFMFDGQGLLHGVTPFDRKAKNAYRYTIVYYSLQQMWNCDPLDDEVARIRKVKTDRERKRVEKHQKFHENLHTK